jgi:sigma-B regulation protein RsbU (phosphoserine phosphatase)
VGEVELQPGDVIAMVTDGVTEAMSPDDHEFGDERVLEALRSSSGRSAAALLAGLIAAATGWAGPFGFSDDLTAMILKAR